MTRIRDIECIDGVITVMYCDGTSKAICGTAPGNEAVIGDYPDSDAYANSPACYIAFEIRQQLYRVMNAIQAASNFAPDGLVGSALATGAVVAALGRRAGDYPLLLVPVTFANANQSVKTGIDTALATVEFAEFLQCTALKVWYSIPLTSPLVDFINAYIVALFETPSASEGGEAWYTDTIVAYLPLVIGSSIGEFVNWANIAAGKISRNEPLPTDCSICDAVRPEPPVNDPVIGDCTTRYYFSGTATEPVGITSLTRDELIALNIPGLPSYVLSNASGVPIQYTGRNFVPNVGYREETDNYPAVGIALRIKLGDALNPQCLIDFAVAQINKSTSNSLRYMWYFKRTPFDGGAYELIKNTVYSAPAQLSIRDGTPDVMDAFAEVLLLVIGGTGKNVPYRVDITRLGVNEDIP